MPATQPKSKAPRATRRKRAAFSFRLLQPFFQFLALVIVVLAFTRCSPLAPSTDKASLLASNAARANGGGDNSVVVEQAIRASLAEIGQGEAKVVSESDFRKVTEDVASADDALDDGAVRSLVDQHNRRFRVGRAPKLLFLTLPSERLSALVKDGKVRIDLNARLARMPEKARQRLIKGIRKSQEDGHLDATGYLVMPDVTMKRVQNGFDGLSLGLKIAFGAPSEAQGFLEISRADDGSEDEANAALLDAALRESPQLAVVLE